MKLVTREEYDKMSPVKKRVYEKRLKKYYGKPWVRFVDKPWIIDPEKPESIPFIEPYTGRMFLSTKDFLDANETAANILLEVGEITMDEAIARLWEEIGP